MWYRPPTFASSFLFLRVGRPTDSRLRTRPRRSEGRRILGCPLLSAPGDGTSRPQSCGSGSSTAGTSARVVSDRGASGHQAGFRFAVSDEPCSAPRLDEGRDVKRRGPAIYSGGDPNSASIRPNNRRTQCARAPTTTKTITRLVERLSLAFISYYFASGPFFGLRPCIFRRWPRRGRLFLVDATERAFGAVRWACTMRGVVPPLAAWFGGLRRPASRTGGVGGGVRSRRVQPARPYGSRLSFRSCGNQVDAAWPCAVPRP